MPLRVLIADDHALIRRGLAQVLELERGIELVGEASRGHEAIEKAKSLHPDVAVLDISMPDINGIAAAAEIKSNSPEIGVVILTVLDDDEYVIKAAEVGVSAYVMKDISTSELVKAIRAAGEGRSYVDPSVAPKLLDNYSRHARRDKTSLDVLTRREIEVLDLLSQGCSNRDISDRLFISGKTVKNHLTRVFEKIGVEDRTQAALFGLRHGLGERGA